MFPTDSDAAGKHKQLPVISKQMINFSTDKGLFEMSAIPLHIKIHGKTLLGPFCDKANIHFDAHARRSETVSSSRTQFSVLSSNWSLNSLVVVYGIFLKSELSVQSMTKLFYKKYLDKIIKSYITMTMLVLNRLQLTVSV